MTKGASKKEYISLVEASKASPYSQEYLSLRARQGKLKAVKIGRDWMTTENWLEDYLKRAGILRKEKASSQSQNEYLSLQEASKIFPYSQEYLSLRVRQGKLRAVKIGRNWMTTPNWLKEYGQQVKDYKQRRQATSQRAGGALKVAGPVPIGAAAKGTRFFFPFGEVPGAGKVKFNQVKKISREINNFIASLGSRLELAVFNLKAKVIPPWLHFKIFEEELRVWQIAPGLASPSVKYFRGALLTLILLASGFFLAQVNVQSKLNQGLAAIFVKTEEIIARSPEAISAAGEKIIYFPSEFRNLAKNILGDSQVSFKILVGGGRKIYLLSKNPAGELIWQIQRSSLALADMASRQPNKVISFLRDLSEGMAELPSIAKSACQKTNQASEELLASLGNGLENKFLAAQANILEWPQLVEDFYLSLDTKNEQAKSGLVRPLSRWSEKLSLAIDRVLQIIPRFISDFPSMAYDKYLVFSYGTGKFVVAQIQSAQQNVRFIVSAPQRIPEIVIDVLDKAGGVLRRHLSSADKSIGRSLSFVFNFSISNLTPYGQLSQEINSLFAPQIALKPAVSPQISPLPQTPLPSVSPSPEISISAGSLEELQKLRAELEELKKTPFIVKEITKEITKEIQIENIQRIQNITQPMTAGAYVTFSDLTALENKLLTFISLTQGKTLQQGVTYVTNNIYSLASSQRIDYLSGVTIGGGATFSSGQVSFTTNDAIYQSGSGQVTFSGNVDALAGLDVTGNLTISGASTLAGSLVPSVDNMLDLGSQTSRWRSLYLGPEALKIYNTNDANAEYLTFGFSSDVATLNVGRDNAGTFRPLAINQNGGEILRITNGNVGIGTTSPYAKLSVVGPVVAEYFNATSSTATSTFAGGFSAASSLYVLQNGNVGIGTSNPLSFFSVNGNSYFNGISTTTGQAIFTYAPQTAGENNVWDSSLYINSIGAVDDANLFGIANDGAWKLRVDKEGDVFVQGNITIAGVIAQATTEITGNLTVEGYSLFGDAPNNDYVRIKGYADITATSTQPALTITQGLTGNILDVFDNAVKVFTILDGGNVGIGTTSPYSLLSISNNLNTAANTPLFTIASTTAGTATSTLLTVLANGQLSLGNTTYKTTLQTSIAEGLAGADFRIGLDETNRTLNILDRGDINTDLGLTANTIPTLYIHNAELSRKMTITATSITSAGGTIDLSSGYGMLFSSGAETDFTLWINQSGVTGMKIGAYNFYTAANIGLTSSSIEQAFMYLEPKINQSGTANYNGILMNVTETALGSGSNKLIDLRTGGALNSYATSSKFSVDRTGLGYFAGNVGIGTTSPYSLLSISNSVSTAANTPLFTIASTTAGTATSTFMTVLANGQVVIGGGAPYQTYRLTVNGDIYISSTIHSGSTIFGQRLDALQIGTATRVAFSYYNDETTGMYFPVIGQIGFSVGGLERVRLDASGNIGIGTTTPTAELHIKGNTSTAITGSGAVTATNGSTAVTGSGTTFTTDFIVGDAMKIGTSTTAYTISSITSNTALVLTANYTGSNGTTLAAYKDPNNLFAIDNGLNTNRLTITRAGNVGIGTTNPTSQLTQKSTLTLESAPLGSELTDGTGWTVPSDQWTGDYTNGFTHLATTTASNLTRAVTISSGNYYQISFAISNQTTGSITVALDSATSTQTFSAGTATTTFTFAPKVSVSSGNLAFIPTVTFNGKISAISVKQITGTYSPTYVMLDTAGNAVIEMRSASFALANTFIGVNSGSYNTTGTSSVAVGNNALVFNTTGSGNSALGTGALYNNITGYSNSAVGNNALLSNTTGYGNSAVGYQALTSNTTGYYNSAVGNYALYSNITGAQNIAVGYQALYKNTNSNNTAMGYQALYANTTGFYNTAMSYALLSNTTGSYNTAVGFVALFYSTTGSFNTAIGSNALTSNTTGYGNSAVGNYALYSNRLGSGNSVFGYNAGYGVINNVTNLIASSTIIGAYAGFSMGSTTANILIGYGAGYSLAGGSILSGSGSNNIVIGYNTDLPSTTQNSTLDIANLIYATGLTNFATPSSAISAGNVGIGTSSPLTKLSIQGTAGAYDVLNVASSTGASMLYVNAAGNVGIGTAAPARKLEISDTAYRLLRLTSSHTTGSFIDFNPTATGGVGWEVGATANGAEPGGSKFAFIDSGANTRMLIDAVSGYVGIGTSTPLSLLQVSGALPRFYLSDTGGALNNQHWFMENNAGVLSFGTTTDALSISGTRALSITNNGNVGIGTTSPLQKLHVEGQCVTGDTELSIVKSKAISNFQFPISNQITNPNDQIEKVRIDQIKGGEYVLSLDEKTGKLVPAKITGLLDMGKEPIYKITTEDGKTIRTTAEHPYLVLQIETKKSAQNADLGNLGSETISSGLVPEPSIANPEILSSVDNIYPNAGPAGNRTPKILVPTQNLFQTGPSTGLLYQKDLSIAKESNKSKSSARTFSSSNSLGLSVDDDIVFFGDSSGVIKGGREVSFSQGRESFKNTGESFPAGKYLQNLPDHNSGAFESGFAVADSRIGDNIFIDSDGHKNEINNYSTDNYKQSLSSLREITRRVKIGSLGQNESLLSCSLVANYKQSLKLVLSVEERINSFFSLVANYKQSLKLVLSVEERINSFFSLVANYSNNENGLSTPLETLLAKTQKETENNLTSQEEFLTGSNAQPQNQSEARFGAQWTKVAELSEGDEIAVAGDDLQNIRFVKIAKIEILPPEQVYDIEVEGTHNFVANGILAHNTYLSGNVGIGTSSPLTKLSIQGTAGANDVLNVASSTGASMLYVNAAGNVGIGTANPGAPLTVSSAGLNGGGNNAGVYIYQNTAAGGAGINLDATAGTGGHNLLFFSSSGTAGTGQGAFAVYDSTTQSYKFSINSSNGLALGSYAGTGSAPANGLAVSGNVGIGTTTPNRLLQLATNAGPQLLLTEPGAGTDLKHWYASTTAGSLTFGTLSDSLATLTERLRIDSTGRLGIGTTTPNSFLHIAGATPKLTLSDTGAGTDLKHWFIQSTGGYFRIGTTSDALVDTTATYPFSINSSNGYIGIGNLAPQTLLHLGTASTTQISSPSRSLMVSGELEVQESAYLGPMEFPADSGVLSWIDMPVSGSVATSTIESYTARLAGTDILTVYGEAAGYLGGVIATSTRIGIGTTTPLQILSIYATTTDSSIGLTSGDSLLNNYSWTLGVDISDGGKFKISSSTALGTNDRLTIDGNGNVGIGTTSPLTKLSIQGTAGANDVLNVASSTGASMLYVNAAGNVGIGTTTPNNSLSIFNAATPALGFTTNAGLSGWTMGIDTADANKFKISSSTALGTNDRFVINGAGDVGIGGIASISAKLNIGNTFGGDKSLLSIFNTQAVGSNSFSQAIAKFVQANLTALGSATVSNDIIYASEESSFSTVGTPTVTMSGHVLNLQRSPNTSNTINLTGALALFSDNCTTSGGVCNSSADVLQLKQQYTANTGVALNITTAATGAGALALRVNDDGTFTDSTPFVVDASGNVGIGTTTPYSLLSISNNLNTAANTPLFTIASTTAGTATSTLLTVLANGYVGMGTAGPTARLTLQGTSSVAYVGGTEKVTNGTFDTNLNGWTNDGGWSWSANTALRSGDNFVTHTIYQAIALTAGQNYQIQFTVGGNPAIGVDVYMNGQQVDFVSSVGNYNYSFNATTTGSQNLAFSASAYSVPGWNPSIDNVSVKQITATTDALVKLLNSDGSVGLEMRSGGSGINNTYIGQSAGLWNITGYSNVAVGSSTLYANTAGYQNTAMGNYALAANTFGYANSALGYQALAANTTGYRNSALGYQALAANTTGYWNSALGYQVLAANTTGSNNSALGYQALSVNTTGGQNTAVGYSTLLANTTGSNNSALGQQALINNTTGSNNSALGSMALSQNTTGSNNSALGYGALTTNQTGSANTVIGFNAGYGPFNGSSFASSTIIGYQAGYANSTGSNNIFLGYQAGDTNTTGSNNIALGYDIELASTTGSNQLSIGNLLFGTGINGTGTTISSGNIGIGTSTPWGLLSVNPNGVTGPAFVVGSSTATNFIVTNSGNVGVGTSTATTYNFGVSGTAGGSSSWSSASYSGYKENFTDVSVLSKINNLNLKEWQYKASFLPEDTSRHLGPFSEDFRAQFGLGSSDYYLSELDVSGVALKGVQEIGQIIDLKNATSTSPSIYIDGLGNVGIGLNPSPRYAEGFGEASQPSFTKGGEDLAYKLAVGGDIAALGFINLSTREAKKDIEYLTTDDYQQVLAKIASTSVATYYYNSDADCPEAFSGYGNEARIVEGLRQTSPPDETGLVTAGRNRCPKRLGLIAEEAPLEILSADGQGVDLYKMASFTLAGVKALDSQFISYKLKVDSLEARIAVLESSPPLGGVRGDFQMALETISGEKIELSRNSITALTNNLFSAVLSGFKNLGLIVEQGVVRAQKLIADTLQINKLTINAAPASENGQPKDPTIGSSQINIGENNTYIINNQVSTTTKIFVTPELPVALGVCEVNAATTTSAEQNPPQPSLKGGSDSPPLGGVRGDLGVRPQGFRVCANATSTEIVKFNWWIVETVNGNDQTPMTNDPAYAEASAGRQSNSNDQNSNIQTVNTLTPTSTITPTPMPSVSPEATATPSVTATPSPEATPSPSPLASPSALEGQASVSPSPSPGESPAPSAAPSPSATPSPSVSPETSPSPSETFSPEPSALPAIAPPGAEAGSPTP